MHFDVVIAGGGFAGAYCARALARAFGPSCGERVALIADQNVMVFQPMLAEVAGAALSPLDVVNPLREFCAGTNVLLGRIRSIDLPGRQVMLDAGRFTHDVAIGFEHLVLALGGVVDLSRVPGMPEHGFILKNVGDALRLRLTLINRLEEANLADQRDVAERLLTFVVVGGGYSGVETAGQILDLVEDVKDLYRNLRHLPARVVLVHSGSHLLPDIGEHLGRYAEEQLRARGLEIHLNSRVNAVTASKVFLQDGRQIATHTCVSTVGNAPHPVVSQFCRDAGLSCEKGRVVTDGTLRVKGQERVWAAGDCAWVPNADGTICPPTAQFALRQGRHLGRNLARALAEEDLEEFHFRNQGQLASIGHHKAVAEIFGIQFSGFLAWWLWRTIYVFKLPGVQRKIGVIVQWTMDLVFRRDISAVTPQPSEVLPEIHLEPGDVLFQAGEPARSFYIVKDGRIDLLDGAQPFMSIAAGDHFGELAMLDTRRWRYTAVAGESTTLVSVSLKVFETLAGSSTAFRQLMESSARRFVKIPR